MGVVVPGGRPGDKGRWPLVEVVVAALRRLASGVGRRRTVRLPGVHPALVARGELMEERGVAAALTRLQLDEDEGAGRQAGDAAGRKDRS